MMRAVLCLWLLLAAWPAAARELDGTPVPDTLAVAGEAKPLALNGAGFRKKFMLRIYIGALYSGESLRSADRALASPGARVMRLHFLREIGAENLADGWKEGFAANLDTTALTAVSARLAAFTTLLPAVKTGDVLRLDLLANGQTRVLLNDGLRGGVDGADFQRALLQVWLGHKPADEDMKRALLGGAR